MPSSTFDLPATADRVVVSVNPKAGAAASQQRIDHLVAVLTGTGFQVEVFSDLDQAAGRAGVWHAQGRLRALIGVGGDGTAAALVNRTPPGLPLSMLPAGNENLLARHFRLGTSPESLCPGRGRREAVAGRCRQGGGPNLPAHGGLRIRCRGGRPPASPADGAGPPQQLFQTNRRCDA